MVFGDIETRAASLQSKLFCTMLEGASFHRACQDGHAFMDCNREIDGERIIMSRNKDLEETS